jgi:D-alanyl-lipoteichoic acid acyltransferase DltB (MBOAT superfamily)
MIDLLNLLKNLVSYNPDAPMIFNTGEFFFCFLIFISFYAVLYKHATSRLLYVLAFSLFFYYKSSGWYLLILMATIFADYYFSIFIHRTKDPVNRVLLFLVALTISLGTLFYFKYTNFILFNFFELHHRPFEPLEIILPIGISFYTFQSISYLVDVYKGEIEPRESMLDYSFYMTFFPHLVAGPIVRASLFLPQIRQEIIIKQSDINYGMYFIIKGLFKKAVIADYVAQYNDLIFGAPGTYSGFETLIAIYGYALQIYCDFSGYSDMAIGIARLMGYDLGVNFTLPYNASSITEFWRRWHMSLSLWLRDYVYIPLGGNRLGKWRSYLNQFLTMLIGGFWHGASWKFIFWGAMHGVALGIHKFVSGENKEKSRGWKKALGIFVTFHFVIILWVFFRAENFEGALAILRQVIVDMDPAFIIPFIQTRGLVLSFIVLGLLYHIVDNSWFQNWKDKFRDSNFWVKILVLLLVIQAYLQLRSTSVQPFIYFQF